MKVFQCMECDRSTANTSCICTKCQDRNEIELAQVQRREPVLPPHRMLRALAWYARLPKKRKAVRA